MPQADRSSASKKTTQLKNLVTSKELKFLIEVHNGLSAKIADETGFEGMWGSGLSISAACGVRDNNELSWTQVLDVVEYVTDATSIPLLLDADTGYGNFNNMRRLVRKLEARNVAGVCIEDKQFPKTNSFIGGDRQPLADIDEFAGKIKAARDAQLDDDFCIVARVEALIAGWGMAEALRRADAYHRAGADAILIHSKQLRPDEVLAFKSEWGERCPVVIVPTKYYSTPTEVFRRAGFSVVIWANQMMRACITAMQDTATRLHQDQNLLEVEERIVPVSEVFRLQGAEELKEAERRYLPTREAGAKVVVLAASRGEELGEMTADRPKAMVPISGRPLLSHQIDTFNQIGLKDIRVVRGYRKEAIDLPNLEFVDNDRFATSRVVYSLHLGIEDLEGPAIVTYGDILFQKYIPMHLLESQADICIAADPGWEKSQNRNRSGEFVVCEREYRRGDFEHTTKLVEMIGGQSSASPSGLHGEWLGLMKLSENGLRIVQELLRELVGAAIIEDMTMPELFNRLLSRKVQVEVLYTIGHWFDVDELKDVIAAGEYPRPIGGPR